jgi:hypothetical protein
MSIVENGSPTDIQQLLQRLGEMEKELADLKILIEKEIIPDEVPANPGDWKEIDEQHHDELDVIKAEII